MYFTLLRIELYKIAKRPRTYISFGALAILTLLIQLAIKANGEEFVELFLSGQGDTFIIPAKEIKNGYFVCYIILNMLLVHIPLLVALIAADQISGEAQMGTLRFMLSRPVHRTTLILAKFSASVIYIMVMLIWLALLGLFGSNLIFGTNDLYIGRQYDLLIIEKTDVMWRYLLSFLFATLALSVIAALGILLSVYSENSIGPIVATTAAVIVCTIIQQLSVPIFENTVTPYLFTTHMLGWKGVFYPQVYTQFGDPGGTVVNGTVENATALYKSIAILFAYIIVFIGVAIWQFKRKDILT